METKNVMKKSKLFRIAWNGKTICQQLFWDFLAPPPKKKIRFPEYFLSNEKIKFVQNYLKWRENWLFEITRNNKTFFMGWDTLLSGGFHAILEIAPNKNIKWVTHKWAPVQPKIIFLAIPPNFLFQNLKFSGFSDAFPPSN